MKKILLSILTIALSGSLTMAKDRVTHNPDATNEDIILHAWSWNFPTIGENMKRIADAGYTIIQTSPVQACFSPEGGNKKIFDEKEGNWYHYYQPTDWTIGNNIVGTRDQLKEMMDSANKDKTEEKDTYIFFISATLLIIICMILITTIKFHNYRKKINDKENEIETKEKSIKKKSAEYGGRCPSTPQAFEKA